MEFAKLVDKAWADKSPMEILDAPVSALYGVSEGDAEKLRDAFNVKTVRDLATNKFFMRAHDVMVAAGEMH